MDFTLKKYRHLLETLLKEGYSFVTFEEWCLGEKVRELNKLVMLRHDVDLKAGNSLRMAKLEASMGIRGSYYFRVVRQSNKPEIIKAIVELGHEVGYHYEDMSICNGNRERAYTHFVDQLEYFRGYYPVQTVCMHGSPTSSYDNRDLWKTYDYKQLGVIGEPYFDVDFNEVFYLTDTGRCWNGSKYSVRDKVKSTFTESYATTDEIILAAQNHKLPNMVMFTLHPQRWTDHLVEWGSEWITQTIKNKIKELIIRRKS